MLKKSLALLLPLGLLGCSKAPAGDPAAEGPPTMAPKVGVLTLAAQDAPVLTELAGRTAAYRVSEVRPQVSGIVQRRLFEEGALVRAGQVLYQIDSGSYQAAHDQAQANLADAEANLASLQGKVRRYDELSKLNFISPQALDDMKSAYQQGAAAAAARRASTKATQVELDRTRITAPISGRIGRSEVTEGALVSAGQGGAMATIQQLDPIYVDIVQSSQALLSLKRTFPQGGLRTAGAKVTLRLEDGQRYQHAGVLKFAEVGVDPATGAVTLRAEFPNPEGLLLPGMYVRAEVEQAVQRRVFLVPQQGVAYSARGEPTALVVNARNQAEARQLAVQGSLGNYWVVTAGLRSGDRLIVDGLQRVRPGQPVEAVQAVAGADAPAPGRGKGG
ncbi:efflux RND transporter periplasmic adaptor subunit [Chitinimonas viridis]|uniref:Efflux RND transporter periplasmic adaptor subunit n=1 Tax=Chitinimonas viridis TaxID=664880 RepID=A0ABT8B7R5_9NEIS|nr:efflux RND transporter periplasmic adaptor subunit [Chitinimonas viridis]MDN3578304.1 efflux RND transporter periplasmic adaptor subunit [Chitinimonas viridis]